MNWQMDKKPRIYRCPTVEDPAEAPDEEGSWFVDFSYTMPGAKFYSSGQYRTWEDALADALFQAPNPINC
jgi:hypothetical protein